MLKSELIIDLQKKHPSFSSLDIELILKIFFKKIIKSLDESSNVEIRGFGTLSKKINKAKYVRNPKTNEKIFKEQNYKIHFKIGKTLHKKLNNITALSLGFLNPDNSSFNIGQRNIIGLDVFAQKQFNGFNSWLSYSLNQSQSRFENLNNNKDFTSKSNVTHSVSAALSYKLDGFQFALGWKWQTGKPYTIANDSSDGLEFNDGINTGELPIYHRLDLSSTFNFKMSKYNKLRGKIGLSIRNIYNRKNLISKENILLLLTSLNSLTILTIFDTFIL